MLSGGGRSSCVRAAVLRGLPPGCRRLAFLRSRRLALLPMHPLSHERMPHPTAVRRWTQAHDPGVVTPMTPRTAGHLVTVAAGHAIEGVRQPSRELIESGFLVGGLAARAEHGRCKAE